MPIVVEVEPYPVGQPAPIEVVESVLPTGASTAAAQATEVARLDTLLTYVPRRSTTPAHYVITVTNADTEYSQALPDGTKVLTFRTRTDADIRYAYVTGKVATPTNPYFTLRAGETFHESSLELTSKTLFVASSTAGVEVEVEVWS